MSDQQLVEILEQGDEQQCLAFFQGMPEPARRDLAPYCEEWFRKINKNQFLNTAPNVYSINPLFGAAKVAVFATASFSTLKKLGWDARPMGGRMDEILLDRRPPWVSEWATALLEEQHYWANWRLIRRLVVAGLMEKPDHPHYYLGMISGLGGPGGQFNKEVSIERQLLEDPTLLEDEVWRLFEYEGGGENSLANWDRFAHGQDWSAGLLALMRAGRLPRERLLRSTLEALERDFNHYRAKWFATFHDALAPSPEEERQHADRYLRLLGVSAPNIVSWAFKQVEKLNKAGVYEPGELIGALRPVLLSRQKGIAQKALKLLEKTADKAARGAAGSDVARQAAVVAAAALAHEAAEVQEGALNVLDKFASPDDPELASLVAPYVGVAAASLRSRLERWTSGNAPAPKQPAAPKSRAAASTSQRRQLEKLDPAVRKRWGIDALAAHLEAGRLDVPAATFDGTDVARLAPERRLAPIEDLDDLIDVCARVIEDETLVDDAERACDGLARLCGDKPADFDQRIGPLLKRARQRLKKDAAPFLGMGPADDLCGLVYAWGTGQVIQGKVGKEGKHHLCYFQVDGQEHRWFTQNLHKAIGTLARRSAALAERVAAGQAAPLLSAPTHAGGWIDAHELVRRVNAWTGDDPDLPDVCLALLRIAPDRRAAALAELRENSREWARAIRYALGGQRVKLGETAALWIAAARSRAPWQDDAKVMAAFPDFGPDAGQAASYAFHCVTKGKHTNLVIESAPPPPKKAASECVTIVFHTQRKLGSDLRFEMGGAGGRTVGSVRWTATIWPLARESFFAAAAADLADNLDWWEAQWQHKVYLEPLLDARTPLRHMGLLLLTVGLAAKEPGEYGLATDVAIRAIDDGRLGSDNLGRMLAELLPTGLIKPGRWQKTLAETARFSPRHALVVQQALQTCLQGDPAALPRDYAKLLDLLHELSIELRQGVADAGCRELLARVTSGKAAKSAKALLALESDASHSHEILRQLLEHRLSVAQDGP